jgi:hypothetical protein
MWQASPRRVQADPIPARCSRSPRRRCAPPGSAYGYRCRGTVPASMQDAAVDKAGSRERPVISLSPAGSIDRSRASDLAIEASMLSENEFRFLADRRIAHLATARPGREFPHVVAGVFRAGWKARSTSRSTKQPKRQHPAPGLKRFEDTSSRTRRVAVNRRSSTTKDWARLWLGHVARPTRKVP